VILLTQLNGFVHCFSAGLSCPPAEFLEEPFLRAARAALVEDGILAINVVARALSPHITSVALLQKVYHLKEEPPPMVTARCYPLKIWKSIFWTNAACAIHP
jgi:hypothetical protein